MNKMKWSILAISVAGAAFWFIARQSFQHGGRNRAAGDKSELPAEKRTGSAQPTARDEEVEVLRAQLRERDKALGALMLQAAAASDGPVEKVNDAPAARVLQRLDERLFSGVLDGTDVQQLQNAAESALRGLPTNVKTTVTCSNELCRITLQARENELDLHSGRVLQQVPKKFAASVVLPDGEGQRAVIVATRQEVLEAANAPEK
jgi:hypothetical protein